MTNFLGKIAVLKMHPLPNISASGLIHLPQERYERIRLVAGTVMFVGSELHTVYPEIGIGDVVYVPIQFGTEITVDDMHLKIFAAEDLMAIEETPCYDSRKTTQFPC